MKCITGFNLTQPPKKMAERIKVLSLGVLTLSPKEKELSMCEATAAATPSDPVQHKTGVDTQVN